MAVKYAKKIAEKDNVATCVADVNEGKPVTIRFNGSSEIYTAASKIPFGHKMALVDLKKGDDVIKYGVVIGQMSQDAEKGEWVHCHNCIDTYVVQ